MAATVERQLKRYFGVADASAYSSLSEKSIHRLIASGRLTGYRPVRGRVLVCIEELDAYIRSSTGLAGASA